MIVWGGFDITYNRVNTGGRYKPSNDTWEPTNHDMLEGRAHHTAIWTGSETIVWGGCHIGCLSSGGRYDPATDTWHATSVGENVPREREDPSAVWTGRR